MTERREQLDRWLGLVADGRLDELSPAQVAEMAQQLDRDPRLAQRLAAVTADVADLAMPLQPPGPHEWERVWSAIDRGAATRPTPRRLLRIGQVVVAAAACILLVLGWRLVQPAPAPAEQWAIVPATDVEVNSLEVFGDRSALVDRTGADGGFTVIWVLDDQGA